MRLKQNRNSLAAFSSQREVVTFKKHSSSHGIGCVNSPVSDTATHFPSPICSPSQKFSANTAPISVVPYAACSRSPASYLRRAFSDTPLSSSSSKGCCLISCSTRLFQRAIMLLISCSIRDFRCFSVAAAESAAIKSGFSIQSVKAAAANLLPRSERK